MSSRTGWLVLLLGLAFHTSCSDAEFSGDAEGLDSRSVDLEATVELRLEVSPIKTRLNVGETQDFVATLITDETAKQDVTEKVDWTVDENRLAAIDPKGQLEAERAGDVTVTANYESLTATAKVEIVDIDLLAIAVDPAQATTPVDTTVTYKAIGTYSDNSEKDITTQVSWQTDDESVARFSDEEKKGHIALGVDPGSTQVSATLNGIKGFAELDITDRVLDRLDINPKNRTTDIDVFVTYTCEAIYTDGTRTDVTGQASWSSSNSSIANFPSSSSNRIETFSDGTTNVRATFGGKNATTQLTVNPLELTAVVITPNNRTIAINGTQAYQAEAVYENGDRLNVTTQAVWTSSSTATASISNANNGTSGRATGLANGSTNIRASFGGKFSNILQLTVFSQYLLRVNKSGTGTGTVTSAPTGISCGAACQRNFAHGTSVTLTANPSTNSIFTGWTGPCSGTGTCTVSMTQARTVGAVFTRPAAPTCSITSAYPYYDSVLARNVAVVFTYSGIVTSATLAGQPVTASPTSRRVAAPSGRVTGSVTGPGGTTNCPPLNVTVSGPNSVFLSGEILQFSSPTVPGRGRLNLRMQSMDPNIVIQSVRAKTVSPDFRLDSTTINNKASQGGNLFRQDHTLNVRFKFINLNIVRYFNQIFEVTFYDAVENKTYKLDTNLTLSICKQAVISQCTTGTPNATLSGANGHPQAQGSF